MNRFYTTQEMIEISNSCLDQGLLTILRKDGLVFSGITINQRDYFVKLARKAGYIVRSEKTSDSKCGSYKFFLE